MRHILAILLLLLVPASGRAADLTDATGRTVRVPDRVGRVLPAGPPAAALLAAVAPDLMLGWPRPPSPEAAAFLPPATANLPAVPHLTRGDDAADAVRALRPDLIVDYGGTGPRYAGLAERAQRETGVPTVLLDGSLAATPRTLGAVLHRTGRAEELARLAEAILAVNPPRRDGPKVVFARGADGLDLAVPGTPNAEVFERLGWRLPAPSGGGGSGSFRRATLEEVAAFDPDVVIQTDPGFRATFAASPEWRALRAVRAHRAYLLSGLPAGWIGGPPSLDRLLGLAVLGAGGSGAEQMAAMFYSVVYGRAPDAGQLAAWREAFRPLSP